MNSLDRLPDAQGHLIIDLDGNIIASGGELSNQQDVANTIHKMVISANKEDLLPAERNENFQRMCIYFKTYFFGVTLSNKKIHVVKREYNPQDGIEA